MLSYKAGGEGGGVGWEGTGAAQCSPALVGFTERNVENCFLYNNNKDGTTVEQTCLSGSELKASRLERNFTSLPLICTFENASAAVVAYAEKTSHIHTP